MQEDYVAITVNLAAANTNYNLMDLIQATRPNAPQACRTLTLQSSSGNAAAKIFVGDAALSGTNMGFELATSGSRTYESNGGDFVYPGHRYVRTDTAGGIKLHVEIEKS